MVMQEMFSITCTAPDGERNTFYVFDEGETTELDQWIHEFVIRVTDNLASPEARFIMELKLVQVAEDEWRIDQITHHETKESRPARFRGKCIANELLPAIARRMGIRLRSSPPLESVSDGAVWRTADATQMWAHLAEHLEKTGSEYKVEHITSGTEDFFQLVRRPNEPTAGNRNE